MPTVTFNVPDDYAQIVSVPKDVAITLQNASDWDVELFIDSTPPTASSLGLRLSKDQQPATMVVSAAEELYARTIGVDVVARLVGVY